jgi:septum formation protein
MRLILASSSPRRREILALLGVPFEVIEPVFDERISSDRPVEDEVIEFAVGKAQSVARRQPDGMVIGSDTMIAVAGEKIGKPAGRADAARMLKLLSGKLHQILTSVAVVDAEGPGLRTVERVEVEMLSYGEQEIEHYLDANESLDKAGAYSIQGQGGRLIKGIRGDYLAAVGMPLRPIAHYLQTRGVALPCDIDRIYRERSFFNWRSFGPTSSGVT